jgi:hypothetical protein
MHSARDFVEPLLQQGVCGKSLISCACERSVRRFNATPAISIPVIRAPAASMLSNGRHYRQRMKGEGSSEWFVALSEVRDGCFR